MWYTVSVCFRIVAPGGGKTTKCPGGVRNIYIMLYVYWFLGGV